MKKTNFFYHMLMILALCGFMFCGNNAENSTDSATSADTTGRNVDSMNAAHHRDPSIAFPQPPVTGSAVDSSRVKDSARKQ